MHDDRKIFVFLFYSLGTQRHFHQIQSRVINIKIYYKDFFIW